MTLVKAILISLKVRLREASLAATVTHNFRLKMAADSDFIIEESEWKLK